MASARKVRDCTFGECSKLGRDAWTHGAWLLAIAGEGKPREVVGDKLSEERVQILYDRAKRD